MSDKRNMMSAVVAALASFCAFFATSGIVALLLRGRDSGVLEGILPYLFGWLCAVGVLKLTSHLLPDRDVEESRAVFDENEPLCENKYSVRRDIYASAVTLGALLILNLTAYLLTKGELSAPSLSAVVIGVIVKPFCEESLFRYGMSVILIRKGRVARSWTVLITSVLFALIHKASAIPFALAAGILLGLLATRHSDSKEGLRRGAAASLAVHSAYNLTLYAISALL